MRKLLSAVLLFYSLVFAQNPQVKIPIQVVNGPYIQELFLGLDPIATDCIDPIFGEGVLPPCPAGVFDARLYVPYSCGNEGTMKDYRHGDSSFVGSIEHLLGYQLATGTYSITIKFQLPPNAKISFKDQFGGIILNTGYFTGFGSCNIPSGLSSRVIMTMIYIPLPTLPVFSILTDSINFGKVLKNSTSTRSAVITNSGSLPLIISDIASSNNQFSFTAPALPITIAPYDFAGLDIHFTPTTFGYKSGNIIFNHNSGTSIFPVKGIGESFIDPSVMDSITISDQVGNTQVLFFGGDPQGTDSIDSQFGEFIIPPTPPYGTIARFYLPANNFSGSLSSFRDFRQMTSLPYNGQKEFRIRLQPGVNSPGTMISWKFSDAFYGSMQDMFGGAIVNVSLIGPGYTVIPPNIDLLKMEMTYSPNARPIFSFYKSSINFGTVALGSNFTQHALIINVGTAPLKISEITSTNPRFTFTPDTLPIIIPAWSNKIIPITFTPSNSGNQNGTLLFYYNAYGSYGSPAGLSLTGNCNVVPVELTSFEASVTNQDVLLHWTTASEKNNKGFEIERRSLNTEWKSIAFVSGAGTTLNAHSYSFTDHPLARGSYKYRLKQIDYDGSFIYSKEVDAEVNLSVNNFILNQNYPNPFNPSTQISYSIPEAGLVTLKLYNPFGEEVGVLVNEYQQPSQYTIQFNSSNLAGGVYFYKLTSGNFTQTKKMILLK